MADQYCNAEAMLVELAMNQDESDLPLVLRDSGPQGGRDTGRPGENSK